MLQLLHFKTKVITGGQKLHVQNVCLLHILQHIPGQISNSRDSSGFLNHIPKLRHPCSSVDRVSDLSLKYHSLQFRKTSVACH